MDELSLEQQFIDRGLANFFSVAKPFLKQAIYIKPVKINEDALAVGKSKFGGVPDLPPNMEWPQDGGYAMALVAQINFAELQNAAPTEKLPKSGMLWMYYETERSVSGFEQSHKSGYAVRYFDGNLECLVRQKRPVNLPESAYFHAAELQFSATLEVPFYPSDLFDYEMSAEEEDAYYYDWCRLLPNPINKMLGHSNDIQNPQQIECQMYANGFDADDPRRHEEPLRSELRKSATNWHLLLQIDSNWGECDMVWGDCGRFYLWITDEDLRAQRLENALLLTQCS